MSQPLRVLIADDELLARKRLARLLAALPDVEIAGECQDGEEVLGRVRAAAAAGTPIDVLLLDIQMPGLSGIDAMQLLPDDAPYVIFCTAHTDHAVQAFDAGAVDYLVKPVEPARLQKALDRARARDAHRRPRAAATKSAEPAALQRLAIPTRQGVVLVDPAHVSHAVLDGELVTVYTTQGDFLCDYTLQELQERLPPGRFERVHRRALLNLAEVTRLEPLETGGYLARTTRGHGVEISRQAARDLRKRLGLRRTTDEDEG